MQGEVFVGTAEASNEMIFKHTNGSFSCVQLCCDGGCEAVQAGSQYFQQSCTFGVLRRIHCRVFGAVVEDCGN
jgi:hypothetical protein